MSNSLFLLITQYSSLSLSLFMDLELFDQSLLLTSRLVDRGDYHDALTVLRPWLDTDLSDWHKMIVCINLATVSAMLGQEDAVLAWYDHGIWYEASNGRVLASENKAAFLAGNGRKDE